MSTTSRASSLVFLAAAFIALMFGVGGCNKNGTQDTSTQSPAPATDQSTDQSQDPATAANLAPAADTQPSGSSYHPPNQSDYDACSDDTSAWQAVLQATDPPPPLPEYSQPD